MSQPNEVSSSTARQLDFQKDIVQSIFIETFCRQLFFVLVKFNCVQADVKDYGTRKLISTPRREKFKEPR